MDPIPSTPTTVEPGTPAAAILPVVHEQLKQLNAMPPDAPAAQSKIADILALIKAMLTNPAIQSVLPTTWTPYILAAVAGIGLLLGGGLLGRYTAPTTPTAPVVVAPDKPAPVIPTPPVVVIVPPGGQVPAVTPSPIVPPAAKGCQCGCVTTGKCTCKDCDHPQTTAPAAGKVKVVFYFTSADYGLMPADKKALDGLGVSYELAKTSPEPGTGYRFKGTVIPMPVVVLLDGAGKELDVQGYPVKDWAAFVKKKPD
jgi:hypothetical protein